jgi:hypothetical protein
MKMFDNPREYTTLLLESVVDGFTTWEKIACACLDFMSEQEVRNMCENEFPELCPNEEEDDEEDEE